MDLGWPFAAGCLYGRGEMFLALREIRRAKVRFSLLAVAIGLLVFLVLFQTALRDGLISQFIGALRNQNAPVLVFDAQARKNLEGSRITVDQQAALAKLEPGIRLGRLGQGTFTVSTAVSRAKAVEKDRLVDAVLFGFDPQSALNTQAALGAPTTLIEGRLPNAINEAVASERNSDEGFGLGDVVRLEPSGADITVVGIAKETNYSVSPTLFVVWDTYAAARLNRNPAATVVLPSAMIVAAGPGTNLAATIVQIGAIPGLEALTQQDAVDQSPGVSSVSQSLNTAIGLLLLTALMVIGLFILILTVQKSPSLTLMRAIGARSRTLVATLLAQTSIVVVAGVVVGAALMALVAPRLKSLEISFDLGQVVTFGLLTLILGWLATTAAVWRVLKIAPIDATTTQGVLR